MKYFSSERENLKSLFSSKTERNNAKRLLLKAFARKSPRAVSFMLQKTFVFYLPRS